MAKEKKGYVYKDKRNKKWVARVTFIASDGRRRSFKKSAQSKPEARELLKQMVLKLETKGEDSIKVEKLIFRDVAEKYSNLKIKPPKFRWDRVIEGMRS